MGSLGNFNRKPKEKKQNYLMDEEFSMELWQDLYNIDNYHASNPYQHNGVMIDKGSHICRLVYNGILARDGAGDIYAVVGKGNNDNWQEVMYYPMNAAGPQIFEAVFPAENAANINVAFKDGADHWDNNSGCNYSFNL